MNEEEHFGWGRVPIENLEKTLTRRNELRVVPSFRIAAFNLYNLFGKAKDVNSRQPGPPVTKNRLEALGKMILDLDADAIAFEEVQNEKILSVLFRKAVNAKLKRRNQRPFDSFVVIPARDPRGINVALATRLVVNGAMTFHDREFGPRTKRPTRFSRDLLGVEIFATPTYSFLFFVAHLKSKLGGESAEDKRKLEAKEIRKILDEPAFGAQRTFIEQDMILAGDMNDEPKTPVIKRLIGKGRNALRDVLATVDPNYTFPTHKRYPKARLDFIFASASIRLDSPLIHHDDPVAALASDHYPVSATVAVPKR
jgi:endonuclease/exonuclease/phosphatase family metal-dependent hydrolase